MPTLTWLGGMVVLGTLLVLAAARVSSSSQVVNDDNTTTNGTSTVDDCPPSTGSGIRSIPVAEFDFQHVQTPLLVSLWVLFVSIAKVAFHACPRLSKLFPESCLLIVVGVLLGVALHFVESDNQYQLNTDVFFLILLPPIIIDAGYFLPSRAFFDQFGTIILYAVIGTLINTLMIGFSLWGVGLTGVYGPDVCLPLLHALVFASLLAAVDPVAVLAVFESIHVNSVLYIIVFGESLLNDGVSVVLYHLFDGFSQIGANDIQVVDVVAGIGSFLVNIVGAPGIGIILGLLGGFMSRFTHYVHIMEPLIVIVICYVSFLVPEMLHMSGILGCTFCGITMRKYVEANISEKSQTTIKYAMKMMASAAEAIIFMYLGIAAVSNERVWNTPFILLTLLFCLVYRVIAVIIQTFVANRHRLTKLTAVDQFIMSFAGLRGAIAFSLSVLLDSKEYASRNLFITATIVVIYFTNLVMGVAVAPLIKLLKVKRHEQTEQTMNEKIATRMMDHLMTTVEAIADQRGHHHIRERFSAFNNNFLKPIIVGRHPRRRPNARGRGSEIFRVYLDLNTRDARRLSLEPYSGGELYRWRNSIVSLDGRSTGSGRSHSPCEVPTNWRGSVRTLADGEVRAVATGDASLITNGQDEAYDAEGKDSPCSCTCHANSDKPVDLRQTTPSSRLSNEFETETIGSSDPLSVCGEEYARRNTKRVSFGLIDVTDVQSPSTIAGGGSSLASRRRESTDSSCVIDLVDETNDSESSELCRPNETSSSQSTTSSGGRSCEGRDGRLEVGHIIPECADRIGICVTDVGQRTDRDGAPSGIFQQPYITAPSYASDLSAGDGDTPRTDLCLRESPTKPSESESSFDDVTCDRLAGCRDSRDVDASTTSTSSRTSDDSSVDVDYSDATIFVSVRRRRLSGDVSATVASTCAGVIPRSVVDDVDEETVEVTMFSYINEACVIDVETPENRVSR